MTRGFLVVAALVGGLSLALFAPAVLAAIPTGVTAALGTAATDVAAAGGLVLLVVIAIMAIKWLMALII